MRSADGGSGVCVDSAYGRVAGCRAGDGMQLSSNVHDLEATLAEHYLNPLSEAGITASVVRTCRFADPVDAPWHLWIELQVDAPEDRVADVLTGEGVVVVRDREPMIVQQVFNEPGKGWDGILATSGNRSRLSLERSYATHSGWTDALGWGEVCPDSPNPGPETSPA